MKNFNQQISHCERSEAIQFFPYDGIGLLRRLRLLAMTIILLLILPLAAHAENNVKASLVPESQNISAGNSLHVSIKMDAPPGWHTYYKEPGDSGLPTRLTWQLPEGFSAGEIEWPEPTKFSEEGLVTYGYSGTTILPVTISVPQNLTASSYDLSVKVDWLECNNICIPGSANLSVTMPVAADTAVQIPPATPQKKTEGSVGVSLIAILISALAGGLVLNIMPCVLPILSLKALALVKKSGHIRSHTAKYGVAYTLGILASFAFIAAILITLQQGGQAIGWGFQMQSPAFVGFLIYLLFLVGLNLSGLFHLPVLLGGVGNNITNENTLRGSFFTGILATLVATPCTAPFMASAVGAALTLPAWAAMLTFLALGFGLALPFLLISIFPGLLRFLPKPGAWMVKFKEFLAFPMYAAVIWLIWVLGMQVGIDGIALTICGLLLIVFMIWLEHIVDECKVEHRVFTIFAVATMLAAILFSLQHSEISSAPQRDAFSVPYSASGLAQLRSEGKAVYVDATAAWCITCQINKHVALDTKETRQAFVENDVTFMVADWTRQNPEITEFLHSFGHNGVPLNVFYPAGGGEPVVLPQVLSSGIVIETIKNPASR